jgi:hypothetical protein
LNYEVDILRPHSSAGKGTLDSSATALPRSEAKKRPFRKPARLNPTVSWYGKIIIIGALLVTFGWELFHLVIALMTLD